MYSLRVFEVENKKQLAFFVTKTSDGQPIDFEPVEKPNDRHVIYFNYDSIVDFSIGVKAIEKDDPDYVENKQNNSQDDDEDDDNDEETLNAEIESNIIFLLFFLILVKIKLKFWKKLKFPSTVTMTFR